jgi:hypothetical protein
MSIFKKASDLNELPKFVDNAYFENTDINIEDEFSGLLKEASSNQSVYENRVRNFKKVAEKTYEFEKPEPAIYKNDQSGIRRVGNGQRFSDESSELFAGQEKIRNISFDNDRYAESALKNGLSIWDPEFDAIREAFQQGQEENSMKFERLSAVEKRKITNKQWEVEQMQSLRQSNVLPHRGLGLARIGNERPLDHGKFGSKDDFYAQAQDDIREMVRTSNRDRKAMIERQGFNPEEARSQWENKESIAARTMESLEKTSLLAKFAQGISIDDK